MSIDWRDSTSEPLFPLLRSLVYEYLGEGGVDIGVVVWDSVVELINTATGVVWVVNRGLVQKMETVLRGVFDEPPGHSDVTKERMEPYPVPAELVAYGRK